jgi:predicted SnoaL-like aldol condensation-catalyzing enzyme
MKNKLLVLTTATLIVSSSAQSYAQPPVRTPEEQRNLDTAIDFFQNVLRAGKTERLKEFVPPKFIEHNPEVDGTLESITHYFEARKKAHPEARPPVKIVQAFAAGDLVCLIIVRGTEPDPKDKNRTLAKLGVEMIRLKDGKQVEHWDEHMLADDAAAAKPNL